MTYGVLHQTSGGSASALDPPGAISADVTATATTPTAILTSLLTEVGGTVGSHEAAGTHTSDFAILQPPNIQNLFHRIAIQSQCIQYFHLGLHYLKYMDGSYATTAVIGASDVFQNQAWINHTNKAAIANDLDASYYYFWDGFTDEQKTAFRAMAVDDDSTSDTTYGTLSESFNFAHITDATQAANVLAWILADRAAPRMVIEFIGTLTNNIARKPGDVITYDTTDANLDALLADMVSSATQFLVLNTVFQPDGAIRITTVELP